MRWRTNLATLGLTALVLLPSLGACGGSDDRDEADGGSASPPTTTEPATSTPTSSTPASTTDPTSDEAQIRQLIADWYEARAEIIRTNDLNDPRIDLSLVDEARDTFRQGISDRIREGLIARHETDARSITRVRQVSVDGAAGWATECLVDAGALIVEATGEVVDDQVTASLRRNSVRYVSGRWRISRIESIDEWKGATECVV